MTHLVFTAAQERDAYRFAAAVDKLLGYPRTHPENELRRSGNGPHAAVVRTETQCQLVRLGDGRYAVSVDDTVRALEGRQAQVTDGSVRTITINTAAAVTIDVNNTTQIRPRGGIVV